MDRIALRSNEINKQFYSFYYYDYTHNDRLEEMFDPTGMQITVRPPGCYERVIYDSDIKCSYSQSKWTSRKIHPFIGMLGIGNERRLNDRFLIQVSSELRMGSFDNFFDEMTLGNFTMTYKGVCRYNGAGQTQSVCDIFFFVCNSAEWGYCETPTWVDDDQTSVMNYGYYMYLFGFPSNGLFAYTMLSKSNGQPVTDTELRKTLNATLNIISGFHDIYADCKTSGESLVVPITFTVGNSATVSDMTPPKVKGATNPGFIQFYAKGKSGSVYAICPGLMVDDCSAEFVCVGGASNHAHAADCNDFLSWGGYDGKTIGNQPANYSHSEKDIKSTIMIFYR
uniref:Uncharacterized protein LOC100183495 n=1 Tax=Phallusia mammillata TaxID=59560 RepID=A0A6F9DH59_9ASCI|nr:uncharacterized protein LOC100183495 [Phallusia mammillata]